MHSHTDEKQSEERMGRMEGDQKRNDENLPPGFRFHPTDEELITYYLVNKISDANFTARAVADVDLNKCEPWDLPGKAKMGEKEWYFFSQRDRKYPTGVRTNRATNTGYWKTTGKDKEIFNSTTSELVGMKKTLVFYKGRAPRGEKTNWVMHEYRINSKSSFRPTKDEWVVCRVFKKTPGGAKKFPSNQSSRSAQNNPYMEIGSSSTHHMLPPPPLMMPTDHSFHFPTARTTSFMGLGGSAVAAGALNYQLMNNLPAGINIGLDGMLMGTNSSNAAAENVGYGNASGMTDGNGSNGNRAFMGMENCMDLDIYWPSY